MGLLTWLGLAKKPQELRTHIKNKHKKKARKYVHWQNIVYDGRAIGNLHIGESVDFKSVNMAYRYAYAMNRKGYKVRRKRHANGCTVTLVARKGK